MHTPFIETDCTITSPAGQDFTAGGAYVTEDRAIAYCKSGEEVERYRPRILTDWHGNVIGNYLTTSSWRVPDSPYGTIMYAITATINGRTYYGRTQGPGMVAYLKAHKHQKG